ncbi:DUF4432 family protein [Streptomyces sp. NPDC001177]
MTGDESPVDPLRAATLLGRRMVGRDDQLASVVMARTETARGCPVSTVDIRLWDGIDVQIVPDRGLDVWRAWFKGVPLAWLSRLGDLPAGAGHWNDNWSGGLVTTCGMRNVGAASEGQGQHGRFSSLPASDVRVHREEENGELIVRVTGEIREASALSHELVCRRTITTTTGSGSLAVEDEVTNRGPAAEPAPFLYHVNLGAPLWQPGARLETPGGRVQARDSAARGVPWSPAPQPEPAGNERVYEHILPPQSPGRVSVVNQALGMALEISWSRPSLPRLHQWVHPADGVYALGVEPANCSLLGRSHDRAAGTLPVLQPGEVRKSWVRFRAFPLQERIPVRHL